MTYQGTVQNGVVVLEGGSQLPDGTPVSVIVNRETPAPAADQVLSEEERQRITAILDRIAALPIEGSTDPFSGRDHDKVLYGSP